ncbi:MAG: aspartyl protease family protein [Chloroflexi bacterium]|nr:aspartyl protease family protein [Chloroflexota bacterium]
MGTFSQSVQIAPSPDGPFQTVKALVDTGATYTCLPRTLLEKLGIAPREKQMFILADGRRVEYELAEVRLRIDGRERFTVCVFGEEGAPALLGAVTLEEFGLGVDHVGKRLVPVPGYLV